MLNIEWAVMLSFMKGVYGAGVFRFSWSVRWAVGHGSVRHNELLPAVGERRSTRTRS